MLTFSVAEIKDFEAINELLKVNNLPYSDTLESKIDFIIAKNDGALAGSIGIEKYGADGLLRSLAVEDQFKNQGIGKELFQKLLKYAHGENIETLHLLTNTAREYFDKKGFSVSDRNSAPELISQSKEFSSLCPASSTYMVLEKISFYVQ